jgi:hypothetical protein
MYNQLKEKILEATMFYGPLTREEVFDIKIHS